MKTSRVVKLLHCFLRSDFYLKMSAIEFTFNDKIVYKLLAQLGLIWNLAKWIVGIPTGKSVYTAVTRKQF